MALTEMAQLLGVIPQTVIKWRLRGLLMGHPFDDKHGYLYELAPNGPPEKFKHKPSGDLGGK